MKTLFSCCILLTVLCSGLVFADDENDCGIDGIFYGKYEALDIKLTQHHGCLFSPCGGDDTTISTYNPITDEITTTRVTSNCGGDHIIIGNRFPAVLQHHNNGDILEVLIEDISDVHCVEFNYTKYCFDHEPDILEMQREAW
jgi:hypothetical protein